MLERKTIECDLCVVGGGIAGMCAAISAAREGISVVLMHERPVFGGNASSEIRMWICGAHGENNRETGILEEIALENFYRNPTKNYAIWDSILYDFIRREKNIKPLLNCTCLDAKTEEGEFADGREKRIISVTGYQMTTQRFFEVKAKYFCDSSGDSILAPLTGASFRLGRESKDEFGENTYVEESDGMTMGMSCLIQGRETTEKIKFTPPEWSLKDDGKAFDARRPNMRSEYENFWYLELGGNRDSIGDTEEIRDELIPLAMGMWDHVKNSGKYDCDNFDLDFLGFLPGKRESRRMCGEYIITERDVMSGGRFPDEVAFGGWPIDDHYPGGFFHVGTPNTNEKTPAPYSIPYRALYSKNIENLFFAGRNISMTHMAMSSIRVMATCGLLGEAVGKAASIAVKEKLTPNGVYKEKISDLQSLLMQEDCFIPSKTRSVSDVCKNAALSGANESIRDGKDRSHIIYGEDYEKTLTAVRFGECIEYSFEPSIVSSVHIVFDSDLNRITLPGGDCERTHSTRANRYLSDPQIYMPRTLCREFSLVGVLDGREEELLHIENNRKRAYHIPMNKKFDRLVLKPLTSWGTDEKITVISFDFD